MINPAFVSIEYMDVKVYIIKVQPVLINMDISESNDQALIAPLPLPVNSNFPCMSFRNHWIHPQKTQFAKLPLDLMTLSLLEHLNHDLNYLSEPVREFLRQI